MPEDSMEGAAPADTGPGADAPPPDTTAGDTPAGDTAAGGMAAPAAGFGLAASEPMPVGPIVRAPRQWRAFLQRHPDQDSLPEEIAPTAEAEALLRRVNDEVNAVPYRPEVTDQWDLTLPGDCENMALAKRARLAEAGLPIGALRLADGWTLGSAHAVLVAVVAGAGDYLLDILTPEILPWRRSAFRPRARAYRGDYWHRIEPDL